MKKFILYIAIISSIMSCEKVLDKPNPSHISPEIWDDQSTASLYINKLYDATMPTFSNNAGTGFGSSASISDESPGVNDLIYGQLTAESMGVYSVTYYRGIRDINIAIEGLLEGDMEDEDRNEVLGQVYFLRAWRYWELVKLYGGVPLILSSIDPYEDELNIPRYTTAECIDQIISDLDQAISMLPPTWPVNQRGRVTRGAAMALKGRVLLFWASPQYNPNGNQDRWQEAYEANRNAKDTLLNDGYALMSNLEEIFLKEDGNTEFIFGRLYDFNAEKTHGWENACRPVEVGLDGGTSNNPTWQLVKAFPMANGLPIDHPESGYDSTHFWLNRDPRFEATIAFNGCTWEFEGFEAGRKQWHYFFFVDETTASPVEDQTTTSTGFYCRKAVNPKIPKEQVNEVGTDWPEMRLAEVMLNLAECANEVGKTQEAYDELIAIRERAGIEAGDGMYGLKTGMNKEEMREAILTERQVEFAFENKRHWDLRRYNLFEEKLNGTRRYGIRTYLKPLPDTTYAYTHEWFLEVRDTINLDEDFEDYFYHELQVLDQANTINYPQPQYNFFAIPPDMLDRSPAVEQTAGWENGTFDPLAE